MGQHIDTIAPNLFAQCLTFGWFLRQAILIKWAAVALKPVGWHERFEPIRGRDRQFVQRNPQRFTHKFDAVQFTHIRQNVG